jgi:DNA-binding beta-propeller fold protein YncE
MHTPLSLRRRFSFATALLAFVATALSAVAGDTYKWTVQYLIDNSQPIFGQSQKISPRRNRGLALSPDGKYLYAGYHHGGNGGGEVRKIALNVADDYTRATVRVLNGPLGKAIACDDKGRVYISNESEIMVYDADLNTLQLRIPVSVCEGVATYRENRELVLYASDRELGQLQRFVVEEKGDIVTGAAPGGFDGTGVVNLKEAASLRGVEVDGKGNIWVADRDGGRVYRVSKDGKDQTFLDIPGAMDIAFLGDRAYVTRGTDRLVAVIEADSMKLIGNLGIPWDELELTPTGNNRLGSLSGIVSVPGKGFFISNETGQTAGQKSTYGKADGNTAPIGGKVYRDAYNDDNDPILRALEVAQ